MRIGLDYRTVKWERGTGVHRYRDRLRDCIETCLPGRNEIVLLCDRQRLDLNEADHIYHDDIFRRAQRKFTLTSAISQVDIGEADLFHWSHPMPLSAKNCHNIYTIHDMIPVTAPELSAIAPRRFERLIRQLIKSGASFTCVSRAVTDDFIGWSGIDAGRVRCTYQPVPQVAQVNDALLPVPLSKSGYFLMLGRVEYRKNIAATIRAWRTADTGLPFVIAGPDGHWGKDRTQKLEQEQLNFLLEQEGVIRLDWVQDELAEVLLQNCRALVMPSRAEGFGLPMIEAMAAGVPVIGSNVGIMPEIVAGTAMIVCTEDEDQMASAISKVLDDTRTRAALVERAHTVADIFSPKKNAGNLHLAYLHFQKMAA